MWILGLASAFVYLLAFTLPYWLPAYHLNVQDEIYQFAAREPWRGVLFYAALAALFGLYLAAYRLAAKRGAPWASARMVGLWACLFCLLLIPVQPVTSSDLYGYVFQGRIVAVLGENPFAHLYKDFAGDPFYFCVTFHHLPASTGYGPLWITIAAGLGWLAKNQLLLNLILFKGLAAGLHLLASAVVYATLKRRGVERPVAGMLFYAWNPLLLYELVGNAHNDVALALFVLLGYYLLSRDRWWLSIPCLAMAVLIKPVAVLWLPLVAIWLLARCPAWPARLRRAGAVVILAVIPLVLGSLPFWAGPTTFRGLLVQSDIYGNSLPSVLVWSLRSFWPAAGSQVIQGVKLLTAVLFVPFYLWQLWIVWRSGGDSHVGPGGTTGMAWKGLVRASYDVMLFYILFVGFQFWPWYLTWLMVLAALLEGPPLGLRRLVAVLLCMVTPLLYFPFGWSWARTHLAGWELALLAALPMIGICAWLGVRVWRHPRSQATHLRQ